MGLGVGRHLGRSVSALVDGQLDAGRAEAAHAHLVGCEQCRDLLKAERLARGAVQAVPVVHADASLADRLATIPELPADTAAPRRHPVRSVVVVGALASMSVFALSLFVLGGQYRPGQAPSDILATGAPLQWSAPIAPAQSVNVHHSAALLQWTRAGGWITPESLPTGMVASSAHLQTESGHRTLHLELEYRGQTITILEQRGELDPVALSTLEPIQIGPHLAYRVNGHWWVLQCDEVVIAVSAGDDHAPAHAVIASLPAGAEEALEAQTGVVERMVRGWNVLFESG